MWQWTGFAVYPGTDPREIFLRPSHEHVRYINIYIYVCVCLLMYIYIYTRLRLRSIFLFFSHVRHSVSFRLIALIFPVVHGFIASPLRIRWWRVNIGKILVTSSKTKCQDTSKVPSIRKNTKNVGFHHHQQQPKPNHPLLRIVTVRSLRRKRRRNWIYSMPKLRPIPCINRVVNYGTGILGSSAISRSI